MDSAIEISSGSNSDEEVPHKAENDERVNYQKGSLPGDLVEEILSRVPAKSVARFRLISKQWNALLKSGRFAKKHSANAPKEESLIIMLIDSRLYLMRINLHAFHNDVAPSVKVAAQLELKDPLSNSSQVAIHNVFHCDGLLLCTTEDNRLVVWNPCSGETMWIHPGDSYKATDYYALGYDSKSSCKRYKILRVDRRLEVRNEHEIYDVTSDSWRVLLGSTDWSLQACCYRGVSVKGITYWVALDSTEEDCAFLLSFDFSTERFQKIHVWVRSSTGSWSKFLTARDGFRVFVSASFLADEQNKVVVCCNDYWIGDKDLHFVGEDKNIQLQVDHHGGHSTDGEYCTDLQNYVPSLAQIQQCGVHKRKAPESQEEPRDL